MLYGECSTLFGRPTNLGRWYGATATDPRSAEYKKLRLLAMLRRREATSVRRPTVVGSVRPRPAAESSPRPFPAVAAVRRARRGPARRPCAVPTFSKQL